MDPSNLLAKVFFLHFLYVILLMNILKYTSNSHPLEITGFYRGNDVAQINCLGGDGVANHQCLQFGTRYVKRS